MKKALLSTAVMACSFGASAQIANGTQAPDFTLTDQFGVTHTMSDYTSAGKVVILDISAVWCGPCWNYHNGHALKEVFESFGPDGTNTIMPLYVEGDPTTAASDLGGGGSSVGDWLDGTPYPMMDDASGNVASDYQISGYPTVMGICPDGSAYSLYENNTFGQTYGYGSAEGIVLFANEICGVSQPANNAAVSSAQGEICDGAMSSGVYITNTGDDALTSATIVLSNAGGTIETINWNGNLATMASEWVSFSDQTGASAGSYTVTVSSPNGQADAANGDNTVDFTVVAAPSAASNYVTIEIKTDQWGSETAWALKDASGATVVSGSGYADAEAVVYNEATTLAAGCYSIEVTDSYGDGMCCSYGNGYYKVFDENDNIIVEGGEFGSAESKPFQLSAGSGTPGSVNDLTASSIKTFPNPVRNELTITADYNEAVNVVVYNAVGAVVYTVNNVTLNGTIQVDMSDLDNGAYFINIINDDVNITKTVSLIK